MMNSIVNPFGPAYNPISVALQIERIIDKKKCESKEIIKIENKYLTVLAHSKIHASSEVELKDIIDTQTTTSHIFLQKASLIAITFGTAWTYRKTDIEAVVANCHKLPASCFTRQRLTVDNIVDVWLNTIEKLRNINPNAHIVFTVSPIRHIKDTLHGNQISKAILIEAIDKITEQTSNTSYFGAYEIMLDDLRDYRFYTDDMLHPNKTAIEYIYKHFAEVYLSGNTQQMITEGTKLTQAVQHRPINASETDYLIFVDATIEKIEKFREKYILNTDNLTIKQSVKILNEFKNNYSMLNYQK